MRLIAAAFLVGVAAGLLAGSRYREAQLRQQPAQRRLWVEPRPRPTLLTALPALHDFGSRNSPVVDAAERILREDGSR